MLSYIVQDNLTECIKYILLNKFNIVYSKVYGMTEMATSQIKFLMTRDY